MSETEVPPRGSEDDIRKHGAMVRFAEALAQKTIKAPLAYVDTRAFAVNTPCVDRIKWMRAADSQLASHPYFTSYVRLEKSYLDDHGVYRCPIGLAHDAIEGAPHRIFLAEPDEQRREVLREQLDDEFIRCDALRPDPKELLDMPSPGQGDNDYEPSDVVTFGYIDFREEEADLEEEFKIVSHFTSPEARGIFQVALPKSMSAADVPPPRDFEGPLLKEELSEQRVLVFATSRMTEEVEELGAKLGYQTL